MIYLCRHGETEWSESGKHTGTTDIDLTENGRQQAARLVKHLESIQFDLVLTSPKKRAKNSCIELMAQEEPLAVEWDYGEYEGLTSWQIRQKNPDWNLFVDGAPGGESPEQVGKRADELLRKIGDRTVVLFSHGHFLRVLAARYLGLEPEDGHLFSLDTASLSILGKEHGSSVVSLWNQTF
jgi:broad specificity phosphatase PhoE